MADDSIPTPAPDPGPTDAADSIRDPTPTPPTPGRAGATPSHISPTSYTCRNANSHTADNSSNPRKPSIYKEKVRRAMERIWADVGMQTLGRDGK